MTKTETKSIQVGTKAIYIERYGAMPVLTKIDKVTPKDWVSVPETKNKAFRPYGWDADCWQSDRSCAKILLHSAETWANLVQSHKTKAKEIAQRAESEKARIKEAKRRDAKEMAETKKAVGKLEDSFVFPGEGVHEVGKGKRLYVLSLPVKPGRIEGLAQSITFVSATVYVEDGHKGWDAKREAVVNGRGSYMTDQCSGTLSFHDCKDDEALLWELVNYLYHRA